MLTLGVYWWDPWYSSTMDPMDIITLWHPNCRLGMASARSSAIWPWLPAGESSRERARDAAASPGSCGVYSCRRWTQYDSVLRKRSSLEGQNRPEPKSESMLCSAYARETSQVWVPGHLVCKTGLCFLEMSVLSRYIKLNHDHFRQEHGFVWNTKKSHTSPKPCVSVPNPMFSGQAGFGIVFLEPTGLPIRSLHLPMTQNIWPSHDLSVKNPDYPNNLGKTQAVWKSRL